MMLAELRGQKWKHGPNSLSEVKVLAVFATFLHAVVLLAQ